MVQRYQELQALAKPLNDEKTDLNRKLTEVMTYQGEYTKRFDTGTLTRGVRKTVKAFDIKATKDWLVAKGFNYKKYLKTVPAPLLEDMAKRLQEDRDKGKEVEMPDGLEVQESSEYVTFRAADEKKDKRKVRVE